MELSLESTAELKAGCVSLPEGAPSGPILIRFGCIEVEARQAGPASAGQMLLACDLWERLALPYEGIRLSLRWIDPSTLELGPSIVVLYAGAKAIERAEARERADLYYGPLTGQPGLYGFGFDEAIDWERSRMRGQILDNRPGEEGRLVTAWFAIPSVVRLAWSIRRSVIDQLRVVTANRTFNWVRSLSKGRFHKLLSTDPTLAEHLPETRSLRQSVDLALMLSKHKTVFVKDVHGIKGKGSICVRLLPESFSVRYLDGDGLVERELPDLRAVEGCIQEVIESKFKIVQQAIQIKGRSGHSMHFRVVTTRQPGGGWAAPVAMASVATDPSMIFTTQANGAEDHPLVPALMAHHGMTQGEAQRSAAEGIELSLRTAERLSHELDPLGILGIDLVVDAESHRLWILEANTVPGFGYQDPAVDQALLRSQVDYGLSLQGEWA
jgi:hypothetical protein